MLKLLLQLLLLPFKILFEKIKTSISGFIYKQSTKTDFVETDIQGYYDGNHIYLTSSDPKKLKDVKNISINGIPYTSENENNILKIRYETAQTSILPLRYDYKNATKTKMLLYQANINA